MIAQRRSLETETLQSIMKFDALKDWWLFANEYSIFNITAQSLARETSCLGFRLALCSLCQFYSPVHNAVHSPVLTPIPAPVVYLASYLPYTDLNYLTATETLNIVTRLVVQKRNTEFWKLTNQICKTLNSLWSHWARPYDMFTSFSLHASW